MHHWSVLHPSLLSKAASRNCGGEDIPEKNQSSLQYKPFLLLILLQVKLILKVQVIYVLFSPPQAIFFLSLWNKFVFIPAFAMVVSLAPEQKVQSYWSQAVSEQCIMASPMRVNKETTVSSSNSCFRAGR